MRELRYADRRDWEAIGPWLLRRANPAPAESQGKSTEEKVQDILDDVAARGDEAMADYTRRFDCPGFSAADLRVPRTDIDAAPAAVPAGDLDILREAIGNIRSFHQAQVERSWWTTRPDGTILGQLVTPVDRVGLYVPGGQGGETPLVSSLLMNAIPAQVAGVRDIAVVTPPRRDGSLNPTLLATAHLLGLTELYRAGSAWAVAGLAFGTASIPAVDVIAGPGNIYVATAKRLLVGRVGIDMIAGPSEIAILADGSANPDFLAADMLSQAEHDPLASAILVTPDAGLAAAVRTSLDRQCADLPRCDIARTALDDWGAVILVPDLERGVELINRLAPEHLELALADPWSTVGAIRHAGAIFMGSYTPEPVGDYFAGPNHVLPTLGTARFSSALSVADFCKKSSVIAVNKGYMAAHGAKIARLARLEGLEAHARSVDWRLKD